jgi:hypothetical protein
MATRPFGPRDITPEKRAYNLYINGTPTLGKCAEAIREHEKLTLRWAAFEIVEKCEKPHTITRRLLGKAEESEQPASCLEYKYEGSGNYEKREKLELCEVCQLGHRVLMNTGRNNE